MTKENNLPQKSAHKILSVGGSIIIPKTGFDVGFLKKFRELILDRIKKGDKFVLVVGGGATCRQYQNAAHAVARLSDAKLDWLGCASTWFNAEFVRLLLENYAYERIMVDPNKKIKTNKPIIVAGAWKPGSSTDRAAVLWAKTFNAIEVINLSNIDYVYDKDPNKFSNAKKIEKISWKNFRKDIVGYKWVPGENVPFDPIASGLAEKSGLKVVIMNGKNLVEVKRVLEGKKFKGTIII